MCILRESGAASNTPVRGAVGGFKKRIRSARNESSKQNTQRPLLRTGTRWSGGGGGPVVRAPPPPRAQSCGVVARDGIAGGGRAEGLARHRYGVVLILTVLAVMFSILAPDTPLGRGVGVMLEGATLLGVIATSRESEATRNVASGATLAVLLTVAALVWIAEIPRWIGAAFSVAVVATVLVVLTRGVVRLIGEHGVTIQAVAGALTSYLLIGLLFALIVRFVVAAGSGHYFAQSSGSHVTLSEEIYFSFTTLTTTGYGDLTPTTNVGRMLSVLEMLIGQIYLVTVIGLLIGNLRRARMRRPQE